MKGLLIVVIVVLIGYGFVQSLHALKAKSDFAERVDHQLDFVSDTTMDSVKQDLIADAKKFDIVLAPTDIEIVYEDTEQRSIAQSIAHEQGERLFLRLSAEDKEFYEKALKRSGVCFTEGNLADVFAEDVRFAHLDAYWNALTFKADQAKEGSHAHRGDHGPPGGSRSLVHLRRRRVCHGVGVRFVHRGRRKLVTK